jgi:small nuclear ribonucleoprotein (snRNP)-like protein
MLRVQGDKEIVGTLRGFDEYVNMVLDDVIEYEITANGRKEVSLFSSKFLASALIIDVFLHRLLWIKSYSMVPIYVCSCLEVIRQANPVKDSMFCLIN